MTSLNLALLAAFFCAVSGIPALFRHVPVPRGRRIAYSLISIGAVLGLYAAAGMLLGDGRAETCQMPWNLPLGNLAFRLDHLSAFFMIPVLIVATCVSIYSCGYFSTSPDNRGEAALTFYLGITAASLVLILLSASGVTLLIFWELMAMFIFFALCFEHGRLEVRSAGLQYLVASHVATLALVILFSLLAKDSGSTFPAPGSLSPHTTTATLVIFASLVGFGIKAGIMPLHVWLPTAHANAPSHISALMSGVVIKMGIYGLFRVITFFTAPPLWWGILFLCLAMISAVAGVLFAIGQHDIKRLLAYHSIENIGIIVMGMGVGLLGLSTGNQVIWVLGMAGALLHTLNHALFKSLLFLGAGAVIHASGTREIDRMGGLSRAIPFTSSLFLVGAVAICGLPPLNGFVSEFLIYLGIFKGFGTSTGTGAAFLALAAPALALTGGLAVACFVKVYGAVFLGVPRYSPPKKHEHPAMTAAMAILGVLCVGIGFVPVIAIRFVEPVVSRLFPGKNVILPSIQTTAHLYGISLMAGILALFIILLVFFYANRLKSQAVTETVTWDCGYAAPHPRMQYTASSFAEMLVKIFSCVLRPDHHEPHLKELFPARSSFHSNVPEVVFEKWVLPFLRTLDDHLSCVRKLQSGQLNRYILYIFVTLIVLLVVIGGLP